jgi:hypothetical protein
MLCATMSGENSVYFIALSLKILERDEDDHHDGHVLYVKLMVVIFYANTNVTDSF